VIAGGNFQGHGHTADTSRARMTIEAGSPATSFTLLDHLGDRSRPICSVFQPRRFWSAYRGSRLGRAPPRVGKAVIVALGRRPPARPGPGEPATGTRNRMPNNPPDFPGHARRLTDARKLPTPAAISRSSRPRTVGGLVHEFPGVDRRVCDHCRWPTLLVFGDPRLLNRLPDVVGSLF